MSAIANSYIDHLEAEAIFIIREVAAQFKNPALLFSGGKDSATLIHLAKKAFAPCQSPFRVVHIDTGHNFPETIIYRDQMVKNYNLDLLVRKVEDTMRLRRLADSEEKFPSRNWIQTFTLLDTIKDFSFDACIGGARRDEERARAKERVFSIRGVDGLWKPETQRPELWGMYNGRIKDGENVRVFPISNWTEIDVWSYITKENIPLPEIYFSHPREVIKWNNRWMAVSPYVKIESSDEVVLKNVRYRTVGDMTCTAAVESTAITLDEVISEISSSDLSERGETRVDDQATDAAMEDRKRMGYF
jgi:sulfate adenylyltransferase subunit 2